MPRFKGDYSETFVVDAPIDKAKGHFADMATIAANYGGLQSHRIIDDATLQLTLIPKSEAGVTFHGAYTGVYRFSAPDVLEWSTSDTKNMWSNGRARFVAVDDRRTRVEFSQKIECEMQVNMLLGKIIQPIVTREINQGVKGYLERMRASLARKS